MRTVIRSARLPASSDPISFSMPRARAPRMVDRKSHTSLFRSRYRVVERSSMRPVDAYRDQVGALAGFERSDFLLHAESARSANGRSEEPHVALPISIPRRRAE